MNRLPLLTLASLGLPLLTLSTPLLAQQQDQTQASTQPSSDQSQAAQSTPPPSSAPALSLPPITELSTPTEFAQFFLQINQAGDIYPTTTSAIYSRHPLIQIPPLNQLYIQQTQHIKNYQLYSPLTEIATDIPAIQTEQHAVLTLRYFNEGRFKYAPLCLVKNPDTSSHIRWQITPNITNFHASNVQLDHQTQSQLKASLTQYQTQVAQPQHIQENSARTDEFIDQNLGDSLPDIDADNGNSLLQQLHHYLNSFRFDSPQKNLSQLIADKHLLATLHIPSIIADQQDSSAYDQFTHFDYDNYFQLLMNVRFDYQLDDDRLFLITGSQRIPFGPTLSTGTEDTSILTQYYIVEPTNSIHNAIIAPLSVTHNDGLGWYIYARQSPNPLGNSSQSRSAAGVNDQYHNGHAAHAYNFIQQHSDQRAPQFSTAQALIDHIQDAIERGDYYSLLQLNSAHLSAPDRLAINLDRQFLTLRRLRTKTLATNWQHLGNNDDNTTQYHRITGYTRDLSSNPLSIPLAITKIDNHWYIDTQQQTLSAATQQMRQAPAAPSTSTFFSQALQPSIQALPSAPETSSSIQTRFSTNPIYMQFMLHWDSPQQRTELSQSLAPLLHISAAHQQAALQQLQYLSSFLGHPSHFLRHICSHQRGNWQSHTLLYNTQHGSLILSLLSHQAPDQQNPKIILPSLQAYSLNRSNHVHNLAAQINAQLPEQLNTKTLNALRQAGYNQAQQFVAN